MSFEAFVNLRKSETDASGNWYVEGLCATSDLDLQGDVITKEALEQSASDLVKNSTVLFNHDDNEPIGKVVEAKAVTDGTETGLWVKVLISKTAPMRWQQIKEGVLNKFSIRGKVLRAQREFVAALNKVVNVIYAMKLFETSIVSIPANPEARTLGWYVAKAMDGKTSDGGNGMKFMELLKQLLEKGKGRFQKFHDRFSTFAKENNVDLEKATDEEVDGLWKTFSKEACGDAAAKVIEAMKLVQSMQGKAPDDMKGDLETLAGMIQEVADCVATNETGEAAPAGYPYPSKAQCADGAGAADGAAAGAADEEVPPKKGKGRVKAFMEFIAGKEAEAEKSGTELDLDALKVEFEEYLKSQGEEIQAATQKSITELSEAVNATLSKQFGDVNLTLTSVNKALEAIPGISDAITKQSTDIQALAGRIENIEKAVPPRDPADNATPTDGNVFKGVFKVSMGEQKK